uniref:Uncharacterized protein n=1 Tax=Phasianus colchicus TaxID=9054 RepID=A0A669Q2F2_PHACC
HVTRAVWVPYKPRSLQKTDSNRPTPVPILLLRSQAVSGEHLSILCFGWFQVVSCSLDSWKPKKGELGSPKQQCTALPLF